MKEGITKRTEDYSEWYSDVISAADLADYGPVKGQMIIKPNGYAIWENIQVILDKMFKEKGSRNAYFPLLIPEGYLKKEAEHVEGFAPEVAVVTHAGGKKLEESLVVRPTSETVIYNSFSKWIHSYRDLPLILNQWANIVRWELRTRLFLRTSEFLWQEGHTAFSSELEADNNARTMLDVYKEFSESYLAIPVISGTKSESEKFAGAVRTYSIEAMMQDKKALQMGTSHLLGQNFAKAFNVKFLDEAGKEKYVWQTSWGVSTRLIGGLIMAHSDDKGLVLPPRIAPIQVIIIPITNDAEVLRKASEIIEKLKAENIRTDIDKREMRPGPKFFEAEKKGIPIRIELGLKEVESNNVVMVSRINEGKTVVDESQVKEAVEKMLDDMQKIIFEKALKFQKENTREISSYEELKEYFINNGGFAEVDWCMDEDCEKKFTEEAKASIRCIPFDKKPSGKCIVCGKQSKARVVVAKAY